MRRSSVLAGLAATALLATVAITDREPVAVPRSPVALYGTPRPTKTLFQFGVDLRHRTINLGVLSDLSGPQAVNGRAATAGQKDYWNRRNAAGGIEGWRVRLVVRDTRGSVRRQRSAFTALLPHIAAVQQSFGYPGTRSILRSAASRKLLVAVTAAREDALFGQPNLLVVGAPWSADIANAVTQLPRLRARAGVALVYDPTAIGDGALAGYGAALARRRDLHDAGRFATGAGGSARLARRLALADADAVVLASGGGDASALVRGCAALGYRPRWILQDSAWTAGLSGMTSSGAAPSWLLTTTTAAHHSLAWAQGSMQAATMAVVLARAVDNHDLTPRSILNAKLTLGTVRVDAGPAATFTPRLGPGTRRTVIVTPAGGAHPPQRRLVGVTPASPAARVVKSRDVV